MAVEFGTAKTVFILAIVVGCFAVLWPKLFYPMLQASVHPRSTGDSQEHYRQERPPHLRPDMMHPALRERGRAIPPSHIMPRTVEKEPRPPIPGMRPPMGGAGHVVPAPKSSSTMGIIMPIYTIGIVIFFMYTIMKVMFKKPSDSSANYVDFTPDPEFRRMVFESPAYEDNLVQRSKLEPSPPWKTKEDTTKLGDIEIDHLRRRLEETEAAMERIVAQMGSVPRVLSSSGTEAGRAKSEDDLSGKLEGSSASPTPSEVEIKEIKEEVGKTQEKSKVESSVPLKQDTQVEKGDHPPEDKAKVKVMGMEATAMCEGGHRWSRPSTPVLGIPSHSRSSTPVPPPTPEPQAIYLQGSLPSQSQLLVADSVFTVDRGDESEEDPDPPVILSGKMTLSLISLDAALAAEDEQYRQEQAEREGTADKPQETTAAAAVVASAISVSVEGEDDEGKEEDGGQPEEVLGAAEGAAAEAGGAPGEQEDEHSERKDLHLVNDVQCDFDETPSATNFTTASAAAEATGNEETAADFSAMESFGPEDEQQDLDVGEEVWNGDVHSGEEEEEEEEEENSHPVPQAPQQ